MMHTLRRKALLFFGVPLGWFMGLTQILMNICLTAHAEPSFDPIMVSSIACRGR
jgi:hypothetical protein